MKKLFRLMSVAFLAAGLSVAFTACEPETVVKTDVIIPNDTITFEDLVLDSSGYWNGSDLTGVFSSYESWGSNVHSYSGSFHSGILTCHNDFNEDQTYFSTWWSGISCSSHTNMDSIGYSNQYSVYASSGAGGSEKFALIGSEGAHCTFDVPVEVKSLMFNNSAYAYWALKDGNDGSGMVRKFAADDFFIVTLSGYDSLDVKTGSIEIPLADFRNSKTYICSEWTKVSMEELGSNIKSIGFSFDSTDKTGEWLNTPTYICIDNIVYEKK